MFNLTYNIVGHIDNNNTYIHNDNKYFFIRTC